jgi:UDPglucose 6-dehydrogenase
MAELGFEVLGLDVLPEKVAALQSGTVPFYEPGLPELLQKNLDSGRLRFTTSYEEVGEFGDVHFVCVGTPQKKGEYAADMAYVDAAFTALIPHAKQGSLLVGSRRSRPARRSGSRRRSTPPAAESWSWPGTRSSCARASPSRTPLTPDRLVFGVRSDRAEEQLRAAFAPVIEESSAGPGDPRGRSPTSRRPSW